MSKQLYEEALADVKKLKEIAEDNAKKALIEAVSPRIKDLIEAELLREADEKETDDDLLLDEPSSAMPGEGVDMSMDQLPGMEDIDSMEAPVDDSLEIDPAVSSAIETDEEGKSVLDLDSLSVEPLGDEYTLSRESVKLLNPLLGKIDVATSTHVESKLFQISEATQKLYNVNKNLKNSHIYQQKISEMVSAVEDLYVYLQESAGSLHRKEFYEGKLEDLYKQLNKLVEQGKMRNKSLNEAEINLRLKNVPEELEDALGDLEVELEPSGEEPEEEPEETEEPEGEESEDEEAEEPEGEEPEGEGDEDLLDLGGEEEEKKEGVSMESRRLSDNTIVEIDEGMLRREIARMKALREADETKPQSWGHGAGDVSDDMDFEEDDLGDPLDMDITTESDVEETDAMGEVDDVGQAYEADMPEEDMPEADMPEEDMPEADMPEAEDASNGKSQGQNRQAESTRRRIAAELKLQTEAKKRAKQAKHKEQQVKQKAQAKKTQAKKQQDKKTQAKCQSEAVAYERQAKKLAEAYAHYANVYNESVRRTAKLKSVLNESLRGANRNGSPRRSAEETSTLRKKLAETNLFNTKLVYCNKLLQNESLTKRQKAEIIERMDEAATEREVKLVYESLIKTLSGTSRPMTEGRAPRVLGSSSQATRPASTVLSEGYEADRWAKLAGLK